MCIGYGGCCLALASALPGMPRRCLALAPAVYAEAIEVVHLNAFLFSHPPILDPATPGFLVWPTLHSSFFSSGEVGEGGGGGRMEVRGWEGWGPGAHRLLPKPAFAGRRRFQSNNMP